MADYTAQMRRAHMDIQAMNVQYNTLCDECEALENSRELLENEVKLLTGQRAAHNRSGVPADDAQDDPHEQEKRLRSKNKQYNALCDECDALESTKETLESEVRLLTQQQETTQREVAQANLATDSAVHRQLEASGTEEATIARLQTLNHENDTLQRRLAETNATHVAAQLKLQGLQNDIMRVSTEKIDAQLELHTLQEELLQQGKTNTTQLAEAQAHWESVQCARATCQAENALKGPAGAGQAVFDNAGICKQIVVMQEELAAICNLVRGELIGTAAPHQGSCSTETHQDIATLELALAAVQGDLDTQHAAMQDLQVERESQARENASELGAARKEIDNTHEKLAQTQDSLVLAQAKLDSTRGCLAEQQAALAALLAACADQERVNDRHHASRVEETAAAASRLAQIQAELVQKQDQFLQLTQQCAADHQHIQTQTAEHIATQQCARDELAHLQGQVASARDEVLALQVELATQQHMHTESVHEHSASQQHLRAVELEGQQQLLQLQSEIASHKIELAGHEEKIRQQQSVYTECVQQHNRTQDQLQHTHKQEREQLLALQMQIETHEEQICQQQTVHTASQHKHTSQQAMREKECQQGNETLLALQRQIETHEEQLCQQQTVHTASQHKHTSQQAMREKECQQGKETLLALQRQIETHEEQLCQQQTVYADCVRRTTECQQQLCEVQEQVQAQEQERVRQHCEQQAGRLQCQQTPETCTTTHNSAQDDDAFEKMLESITETPATSPAGGDANDATPAPIDAEHCNLENSLLELEECTAVATARLLAARDTTADLEAQIAVAFAETTALENHKTAMAAEISQLEARHTLLQHDSDMLAATTADRQEALATIQQQANDLEQLHQHKCVELKCEQDVVLADSKKYHTEVAHMRQEILDLEEQQMRRRQELHAELQALTAEDAQLKADLGVLHSDIHAAQAHHSMLHAQQEAVEQQVERAHADLDAQRAKQDDILAAQELDTAAHAAKSRQQMQQYDEIQGSIAFLVESKQKTVQTIQVLCASHTDYEQKLHRIQRYSSCLDLGMEQLRGSMHLHKSTPDFQVSVQVILDLFGNFLDWFECTFTQGLYDFSMVLLNSTIEQPIAGAMGKNSSETVV